MINLGNTSIKDLYLGSTHVSEVYLGSIKVWPEDTPPGPSDYYSQYLTIEAKGTGKIEWSGSTSSNGIRTSTDNGVTWSGKYVTPVIINVNAGDKVLIKGNCIPEGDSGIGRFTFSTINIDVYGNIHSLLYGDNFIDNDKLSYDYIFANLFTGVRLYDASNLVLPATTLTTYCYSNMFSNCTELTKFPALPATTLAEGCYYYMFSNCNKVQEAPELPATTLADRCYYSMFSYCDSLQKAPELPATTLADSCYFYMFYDCDSLQKAPKLPATTLAENCYYGMFYDCDSLQEAPELPATTLVNSCYHGMFEGCDSLIKVPSILPATTLASGCYYQMFRGCTSLQEAPELPATTLVNGCYYQMFYGCSSLNEITTMQLDEPNNLDWQSNWVYSVASSGTIYLNPDITWNPEDYRGVNGIPEGWLVVGSLKHITFADVDKTAAVNPNDLKAGDKVVIMWGGEGANSYNYNINRSDSGSYILSYRDNLLTNLASHKTGTNTKTGDIPADGEVIDSAVWILVDDEYGYKGLKNYETGDYIQTSGSTNQQVTLANNIANIGLQFVPTYDGWGIRKGLSVSTELNNYFHYNYQPVWYTGGNNNYWKFYKIGTPQPKDIMFLRTHKDGTTFEVDCGESGTTLSTAITRANTTISEISGTTNPVTSITIGDCVEKIDNNAFSYWMRVEGNLVIPDSVTTIGSDAFSLCTGFTGDLVIPDSVTEIGAFAFQSCKGFNGTLTIGSGVKTMGNMVFYSCSNLTAIKVKANTPPTLGLIVFDETNNCPIYVPLGTGDAYKSAPNWSAYASRIQEYNPNEASRDDDL